MRPPDGRGALPQSLRRPLYVVIFPETEIRRD